MRRRLLTRDDDARWLPVVGYEGLYEVSSAGEVWSLARTVARKNGTRAFYRHFNASKTHCKRGHEFTPENTGWQRTGRWCRQCLREKRNAARR